MEKLSPHMTKEYQWNEITSTKLIKNTRFSKTLTVFRHPEHQPFLRRNTEGEVARRVQTINACEPRG